MKIKSLIMLTSTITIFVVVFSLFSFSPRVALSVGAKEKLNINENVLKITHMTQNDDFIDEDDIFLDDRDFLDDNTGDINGDGKINNKDLGLLMQYLNKWNVEIVLEAADVTDDGLINNKDYGLLMKYINM